MSKKVVKVFNYKKLGNNKEASYEFESDGINLIIADNGKGKTSLVDLIQAMHMAMGFVKNPTTEGQEKGYAEYSGTDKSGNPITIRWEFDKNGDNKFSAVTKTEDGKFKPISDPKKILQLMGTYYPLTVDDFFQKVKYAEGRRELIDKYLFLCFTDKQKEEINKLQLSISSKNNSQTKGNLYFQRRDLNNEIDVLKKVIESNTITEEDQKLIAMEQKAIEKKKFLQEEINQLEADKKERQDAIKLLEEQITAMNLEINKIEEDMTTKEDSIVKADQYFVRLEEIKKKGNKEKETIELANKTSLLQKTENDMEIAKKKIKEIYKNSKLPAGLEIDEDEIRLNGFVLDATSNSESEVWMAIIELMCQISDSKLISIGSISEYGDKKIQEILNILEKHGKFAIATKVESDIEEPQIEILIKNK